MRQDQILIFTLEIDSMSMRSTLPAQTSTSTRIERRSDRMSTDSGSVSSPGCQRRLALSTSQTPVCRKLRFWQRKMHDVASAAMSDRASLAAFKTF